MIVTNDMTRHNRIILTGQQMAPPPCPYCLLNKFGILKFYLAVHCLCSRDNNTLKSASNKHTSEISVT